ncbi:MAG: hypothetical protein R6U27_17570 [Desulfobacterales bacterium]
MEPTYSESIEAADAVYRKREARLRGNLNKQKNKNQHQTCCIDGCDSPAFSMGLCSKCYQRMRRGILVLPDLSDFIIDEKTGLNDWNKAIDLYKRFFALAGKKGTTPGKLLAKAMREELKRS